MPHPGHVARGRATSTRRGTGVAWGESVDSKATRKQLCADMETKASGPAVSVCIRPM